MAGEVVKSCGSCANLAKCDSANAGVCLSGDPYQYLHWQEATASKDSGSNGTYYEVAVEHPKSGGAPYRAECQDIIDALSMDFNEGNAFKAIWRRCAARNLGKVKKGNEDPLYDAQKIAFYGGRILAKEEQKK